MLDSCWIMCCVFVVKNESSRLKVMEGFDEEWFGIVTFALVERKYCRIEFVVFLCWFGLFLLIFLLFNLYCWLFESLLFVLFLLLVAFTLDVSKISNIYFIRYYLRTFILCDCLQIFINEIIGIVDMRWRRGWLCMRWRMWCTIAWFLHWRGVLVMLVMNGRMRWWLVSVIGGLGLFVNMLK